MIIEQKESQCTTDVPVCHRPPQARIHASENIQGHTWTRIQIQPPDRPEIRDDRARLFQVLLLDISASMGTAVEQPGEKGVASVFTRLDLAKHAIKTVVMSLTERDAVILMVYNHECTKLHNTPIAMTSDGKKAAIKLIESQTQTGSTAFHPAMSNAIDEILANDTTGFYTSITLFTDGEPLDYPSNGHVTALESKLKRVGNPPITINTIGFTSALKTDILLGYAKLGNGSFIYINDSSMVGTTFVNLLATEQATVATHVATTIKYTGTLNTELIADVYKYDHVSADTIRVYTPHLRYGQSTDIVLPVDGIVSASVQYTPVGTGARHTAEANHSIMILDDDDDEDSSSVAPHVARVLFAHYVHAAERRALDLIDPHKYRSGIRIPSDAAQLPTRTLHGILSGPPFAAFPQVVEIAKDVSGQVFEAVSNEQQFRKWGRHYLPALRTAHVDQRCWNFKDPGVQAYGGAYFEQLRGDNEDIFNSMPPPQPSGVKTGQIPAAAVPKTMASFNNRSNSCHSGDSIVVMADNSRKRVDEIRVGDVVNCDDLRAAAVKCVLKMVVEDEHIPMCHISPKHKVTPYHPVRNGDKWQFPHEIAAPQDTPCKALYSFVLGAFHTISIDGVSAVTLGHKYTQDEVAHPYFGSQQVINDLIKLPGWDEGLVEITAADIHRDEHTGLINRIG